MALNVFGEKLEVCSMKPLTGFFRNGCCTTNDDDKGLHTVCVVLTNDFLRFSYLRGNDLVTPRPEFQFPGLNAGEKWCLCASRWLEAHEAGMAPKIYLEATHEKLLEFITLEELIPYAFTTLSA